MRTETERIRGSAIGQLISCLAREGLIPPSWRLGTWGYGPRGGGNPEATWGVIHYYLPRESWWVAGRDLMHEIPQDLISAALGD